MRTWTLAVLLCLLSGPALAAEGAQRRMLKGLDALERLQDSLEDFFNSRLCAPLKQGRFRWPSEVAAPDARLPLDGFISVESCSVRALGFEPGPTQATARLLFELDGTGLDGGRRSVRGEAPSTLRRLPKGGWRLETLQVETLAEASRPRPRFRERAQEAGLVLPDESESDGTFLKNGSLAVRDFDGDGLVDVLAANPRGLYLFRATAPLRYERTRLPVRPARNTWFSSLAAGDFDADGDPDVLAILQADDRDGASPLLLRNDAGTLTPAPSGLPSANAYASLVSDLDGDGHLDVVLLHYSLTRPPDDFLGARNGLPPRFFLGQGDLSFRAVAPPPESRHARWSMAAVAADLLGEGRPQLYVANDFGDNDLWRLDAEGTPLDMTEAHGLRDPGNGMSADVGDVDGDGRLDVYVANMFSKAGTRVLASASEVPASVKARLDKFAAGNTLYLGREGGRFEEVARARGVSRGLWAFSSIFLDADDDGRLDLAVANGFYSSPDRKDL